MTKLKFGKKIIEARLNGLKGNKYRQDVNSMWKSKLRQRDEHIIHAKSDARKAPSSSREKYRRIALHFKYSLSSLCFLCYGDFKRATNYELRSNKINTCQEIKLQLVPISISAEHSSTHVTIGFALRLLCVTYVILD